MPEMNLVGSAKVLDATGSEVLVDDGSLNELG